MKHFGMTIVAAGLALTSAYYFGAQSVGFASAGSGSCTYTVDTVSGSRSMHAYMQTVLDSTSPSGESTPDLHSFLRINVSALDSGCDAVTVNRMMVDMSASDNAGTKWFRRAARAGLTLEDVDTGDIVATGVMSRIVGNNVQFAVEPFSLNSGETKTIDVYFDANGASADLDDAVQLSIPANGITCSDEHRTVHEMNAVLQGRCA